MHRRKSHRFVPSAFGGPELESRVVLSGARASVHVASIVAANNHNNNGNNVQNGRPQPNYLLGYVNAAGTGMSQNSLNFTSHAYYQIVEGGGGNIGFRQIFNRYNRNGDLNRLNNDLYQLAKRVPYGAENLLPIWQDIIYNGGTSTGTGTGMTAASIRATNHRNNNQAYGALIQQLRQTTADYINGGVGTQFNVLLSQQRHNATDWDLLYNGRVGDRNPAYHGGVYGGNNSVGSMLRR